MRFDPRYQNQYMAYPVNREQDGYAMNGYAMNGYPPPPPGTFCPFSFLHSPPFMVHVHSASGFPNCPR